MTLGALLGAEAGQLAGLEITDLVLDSRAITPGAAFVAVPGGRAHGLDFSAEARARGAAVVLYEPGSGHHIVPAPSLAVRNLKARLGVLARAFFRHPARAITGVTGTNGKTTVAYLVAQALTGRAEPCAYVGTLGYGVPPALETHSLTTPDCLTLHRELAAIGAPLAALEVSSIGLEQERVAGLSFSTAVFTNLTRDHLDDHGDLASYQRAKAKLFERTELEHAVLNANDPFAAELARHLGPRVELLRTSVGGRQPAELVAHVERSGLDGLVLRIDAGVRGSARLRSPLIGEHNAENLLLAAGALLANGLTLADACAALEAARPAPGRMEVVQASGPGPVVVVDYAHTPDALARVLATVRSLTRGAVWCVFGCGGDRDRGKRPLMGEAAARAADHVVLTDDNPRSEDPAAIVADIRAGIGAHASVLVIHDRRAAIAHAVRHARPGDLVLIAGKGHETVQIAGGVARPFDDRAAARDALGGRP
ncbi:MAG TPA: UDP-N-acetylmuramoyl-L-alanyl-D-glutamate--2,6-diaminopimelate ligase [Gammaproteobacteria bacterium]